MAKTVRIALLSLILLTVAVSAWKARVRTTEWTETLRVAVYPISGDGSPAANTYIASLQRPAFDAIAGFMREQAQVHGLKLRDPVELYLAPRIANKPPAPPGRGTPLEVMAWSLKMRWWAWRNDGFDGPRPHVRVFVQYHKPVDGIGLDHSIGLRQGMIVLANAFASADDEGGNNVVIAHELLHTFGASDKYDPENNMPRLPDGYAEPNAVPLYPQRKAEIMGGRIPRSPAQADIPRALEQTVIGRATAREISWTK
jgi:hypothetical protein